MPSDAILDVEKLCKSYPGFSLSGVTFSIEPGHIYGFIGRNGAGKSTTIKCLEGSVHLDSGSISYFGRPFKGREREAKLQVGFELGAVEYYAAKRLRTVADAVAVFYPSWDEDAYLGYCKRFALDNGKRVRELSQGMRVKFSLALALSRRARLLVLDEPTSGLDPASREELLDIFLDLAKDGTSILFSTHIASDLDKCADRILFLREGKLVANEALGAFESRYACVEASAIDAFGLKSLGERTTARGVSDLVVRSEAEPKLVARGQDLSNLLVSPTLDDIMAFDPER